MHISGIMHVTMKVKVVEGCIAKYINVILTCHLAKSYQFSVCISSFQAHNYT